MCKFKVTTFAMVALMVLGSGGQLSAQSEQPVNVPPANNEIMIKLLKDLLNEMRQLRFALQQNALQQHRSALTLERIRREQDVIDMLEMDRSDLSDQVGDLSAEGRYDEDLDAIKQYDGEIAEASDPREKAELAQEQSRVKRSLERKKKTDGEQLERLRERIKELDTKLQTSRSTIAFLRSQLDVLEREMERQVENAERKQAARNRPQQP
jgi:chromosome segregation ATPase